MFTAIDSNVCPVRVSLMPNVTIGGQPTWIARFVERPQEGYLAAGPDIWGDISSPASPPIAVAFGMHHTCYDLIDALRTAADQWEGMRSAPQ